MNRIEMIDRKSALRSALLGASAITAIGAPMASPAFAQESVFREEIVVTAQKREQSAQDVGISITALSGDQMQALGYTNAQEVTAMAAGVATLQPNGEANYSVGIRGVANNDFTTNVESPVAIYVDETYISQMSGAGFMLFDIDRVEILRGPQGTLFGRNATGGLVHYITVKPNDEEFGGYGSISYERFDRVKAQGAVNLPIAEGLAARISIATNQGDGYVTNRLNPEEKLNNANETAGRIQVLYDPNDDFSLLLNARMGKQDIRTGFFEYASAIYPDGMYTPGVPNVDLGGYVDTDGDIYAGDYDFTGRNKLDTWGATARFDWNLGFGTLTNITDFQSVQRDYMEDSDASPVDYFRFFLTTDAQQFSEEIRLAGDVDRLKWLAGFYYLDLDVKDTNGGVTIGLFEGLFGDTVENLGFNGIVNPYHTTSESWSLFGQLEYALTDDLTLIGGVRYIDEEKTHRYFDMLAQFPDGVRSGIDPRTVYIAPASTPYDGSRSDQVWAFRAQLNYTPTDNLLLYASWNRGTKAGGFNAPLLPTAEFVTDELMNYRPEKLDAYEAGFKLDLADGRLRFNAAGYYYDYKDYQAFSIIGLDTFTLNAQAETKGFEMEMQASPIDGLDFQFGAAYIDAKVEDVPGVTVDAVTPVGTIPAIIPGATVTPVQTPKWNLNGLARYEFPIGYGNIALQVDGQYRSEHFFTLLGTQASTEDGYFHRQRGYHVVPACRQLVGSGIPSEHDLV